MQPRLDTWLLRASHVGHVSASTQEGVERQVWIALQSLDLVAAGQPPDLNGRCFAQSRLWNLSPHAHLIAYSACDQRSHGLHHQNYCQVSAQMLCNVLQLPPDSSGISCMLKDIGQGQLCQPS